MKYNSSYQNRMKEIEVLTADLKSAMDERSSYAQDLYQLRREYAKLKNDLEEMYKLLSNGFYPQAQSIAMKATKRVIDHALG
jgi:hypothetical protein